MSLQGKDILIIEDAPDIRLRYKTILEIHGINVLESESIPEAMELLKNKVPHLIILDLNLPGESGMEFLNRREKNPTLRSVPVLVVSAVKNKDRIFTAISLGANDYILKPAQTALLLQRIRKHIRDQSFKVFRFPTYSSNEAVLLASAQITQVFSADFSIECAVRLTENSQISIANETLENLGIPSAILSSSHHASLRQISGLYLSELQVLGLKKPIAEHSRKGRDIRAHVKQKETPLIYIIDDDPIFNQILPPIMKKYGLRARCFENWEDIANKTLEPPDLCIVDLNLRDGLKGYDLIKTLRKQFRFDLPILMVSATSDKNIISYAHELGASDYMIKPLNREVFLSKITNFITTHQLEEEIDREDFIPRKEISTTLGFKVRLTEIDETGILLDSKHLIIKGTVLKLSGENMKEITGRVSPVLLTVVSVAFDPISQTYQTFLEFDSTDQQIQSNVRGWITQVQKAA